MGKRGHDDARTYAAEKRIFPQTLQKPIIVEFSVVGPVGRSSNPSGGKPSMENNSHSLSLQGG
jgi:hypothetical protein